MKKRKKKGCCKWVLIALVFVLIGYFGFCKLYPCLSSPVIAKPVYTWQLCPMNLFARANWVGVHEKYFGFENGKIIAYILNFLIAYLIVVGIKYGYEKFRK